MNSPTPSIKTSSRAYQFPVICYVVLVLLADILARHPRAFGQNWNILFDWRLLQWQMRNGLDLFKLIMWLIIPFLFCLPHLERQQFTLSRWKRVDYAILTTVMLVGIGAVLAIPLIPSLHSTYRGMGAAPASVRWANAMRLLLWNLSWLPGWEFLHRYVLLRAVDSKCSRYGWLLVPLAEGLYHLEKAWPETLGMVAFSLVATYWARKRRNVLLPFLAHLTIELALIAYLTFA
jgi:membrane protease YdiL (CAAX protease family)